MNPHVVCWSYLRDIAFYQASTEHGTAEVFGYVQRDRENPELWWPHVMMYGSLCEPSLERCPWPLEHATLIVERHPRVVARAAAIDALFAAARS